jgi:hypothetical protein
LNNLRYPECKHGSKDTTFKEIFQIERVDRILKLGIIKRGLAIDQTSVFILL